MYSQTWIHKSLSVLRFCGGLNALPLNPSPFLKIVRQGLTKLSRLASTLKSSHFSLLSCTEPGSIVIQSFWLTLYSLFMDYYLFL